MSKFFNSGATSPTSRRTSGLRQVVLQAGNGVAGLVPPMDGEMQSLRTNLAESIEGKTAKADELATKVANLNTQIVEAEGAGVGAMANGLRDQRDSVLKQLSGLIDTRTVEQPNGVVNVYVGSEPLVSNGNSRGIKTVTDTDADGHRRRQRSSSNPTTANSTCAAASSAACSRRAASSTAPTPTSTAWRAG
jgi:flagellar hook-associated protein 1 FlgK